MMVCKRHKTSAGCTAQFCFKHKRNQGRRGKGLEAALSAQHQKRLQSEQTTYNKPSIKAIHKKNKQALAGNIKRSALGWCTHYFFHQMRMLLPCWGKVAVLAPHTYLCRTYYTTRAKSAICHTPRLYATYHHSWSDFRSRQAGLTENISIVLFSKLPGNKQATMHNKNNT